MSTQINQYYDDYLGEDEMVENSESGDYVVYTTLEEMPVADAEQIAVTEITTDVVTSDVSKPVGYLDKVEISTESLTDEPWQII